MAIYLPNLQKFCPEPGITTGILWAEWINEILIALDSHNHTTGSGGGPIEPSITGDYLVINEDASESSYDWKLILQRNPLQTANYTFTFPVGDGTSGQVLTTDGSGNISWTSATATSLGGLADVTLTTPSSNQILQYDGSKWVNATLSYLADPMTTRGDMIYRNSLNSTVRLPIGSAGYVLKSDGTDVSWQAETAGTTGNLTSSTLTVTGGTGAVVGSGATVEVPASTYEPYNTNIQLHISSTSNPHNVTYTQVGAEPANANIQSHISSTLNPHSVTQTQIGLSNVTNDAQVKKASSSTDNTFIYWNGITGDAIKDSGYSASSFATAAHNHSGVYEPVLTKGNLTESTSTILTIVGGTGSVIGSGTSIQVAQATTSTSGFLSSTDWNTFNGKQAALTNPVTGSSSTEVDGRLAIWSGNNAIDEGGFTSSTGVLYLNSGQVGCDTNVSPTELGYLDGVTSSIQSQLNAKPTAASAYDNNVTRYDGTSNIQGSGWYISDAHSLYSAQNGSNITFFASNEVEHRFGNDSAFQAGLRYITPDSTNALKWALLNGSLSHAVVTNDLLGDISWQTYISGYTDCARIRAKATGNHGTSKETSLTFTVGDAAGTLLDQMIITPSSVTIQPDGSTDQLYIHATSGVRFPALTASRVPYLNASSYLTASSVTDTELGYLSGVSSAIQTQINAKITAPGSLANGDILYYNSGWQRLGKGTDGHVLTLASGLPSWAAGGSGSSTFLALTDTPASFSGQGLKGVRVNTGETALEFYTIGAGSGDVVGPASATDNAIARFDDVTGKLIQNSVVTIADTTGNMAGVGTLGCGAITTTGVLTIPVGSAAAPSLTFAGDTNTGIYNIGADQLGISTGGTLRLTTSTTAITSTLPFYAPDGSVSAPSLTFSSDTNTGIYRIGTDNLGISLNGTKYVDLSTSTAAFSQTTEATSATTGAITCSGGISAVKNIVSGGQVGAIRNDAGNTSTALTIDWNSANVQTATMTGNCTFTFSNPIDGFSYVLILKQDATGSRLATWPATVKWAGGTAPTLSTAANAIDILTFVWDGTSYYGNFQGAWA